MKDASSGRALAWLRRYWAHHVAAGLLLLGLLVALGVFSSPSARKWVALKAGGPHGTKVTTIQVPAVAVKQTAGLDEHKGARDETPPGAPSSALNAAQRQQDALAATDQLPIVTPWAAPEQAGCVTRLVQNYSSRRGVRPRLFVLHYTVSPNRSGWSDVYSVVYLFDQAAFQASSNYVIDSEGHCAYIVRESDKAWTQAAMNPVSISVEVINSGSEPTYAGVAGLARVGQIGCAAMTRWQIPLQVGAVSNGVVTRPGLVDHNMLGAVGGGHHDITPYAVGQVLDAVKRACAPSKPKPKPLASPAVLRAKTGEWSWIAWRFGHAAWKGYPKASPAVRPHVPVRIPAAWWRDAARHGGAKR
jgi:N-acetyl-anhydromuramyl-L-alanine amidase AmpD